MAINTYFGCCSLLVSTTIAATLTAIARLRFAPSKSRSTISSSWGIAAAACPCSGFDLVRSLQLAQPSAVVRT